MEKNLFYGLLYDYYGSLLKGNQAIVIDLYYNQDFSLGEISEELGISRAGIYDSLKRAEKKLDEYEKKLALYSKLNKIIQSADNIIKTVDKIKYNNYEVKNVEIDYIGKEAEKILNEG